MNKKWPYELQDQRGTPNAADYGADTYKYQTRQGEEVEVKTYSFIGDPTTFNIGFDDVMGVVNAVTDPKIKGPLLCRDTNYFEAHRDEKGNMISAFRPVSDYLKVMMMRHFFARLNVLKRDGFIQQGSVTNINSLLAGRYWVLGDKRHYFLTKVATKSEILYVPKTAYLADQWRSRNLQPNEDGLYVVNQEDATKCLKYVLDESGLSAWLERYNKASDTDELNKLKNEIPYFFAETILAAVYSGFDVQSIVERAEERAEPIINAIIKEVYDKKGGKTDQQYGIFASNLFWLTSNIDVASFINWVKSVAQKSLVVHYKKHKNFTNIDSPLNMNIGGSVPLQTKPVILEIEHYPENDGEQVVSIIEGSEHNQQEQEQQQEPNRGYTVFGIYVGDKPLFRSNL